jgi:hypothetical protein
VEVKSEGADVISDEKGVKKGKLINDLTEDGDLNFGR